MIRGQVVCLKPRIGVGAVVPHLHGGGQRSRGTKSCGGCSTRDGGEQGSHSRSHAVTGNAPCGHMSPGRALAESSDALPTAASSPPRPIAAASTAPCRSAALHHSGKLTRSHCARLTVPASTSSKVRTHGPVRGLTRLPNVFAGQPTRGLGRGFVGAAPQ
eukprot:763792-Prymnesium_polylepis.1